MSFVSLDGDVLPPAMALIDSGADCSMFPAAWARRIGIDLESDCEKTSAETAGGPADSYVYEPGISVVIEDKTYGVHATFSKNLPVGLLGRQDFFVHHRVTFDERAKTFTLEPYDAHPEEPRQ